MKLSGCQTGVRIRDRNPQARSRKFDKSRTRDWDRDASKNPGPEPGLTIFSSGTEILSNPGCVPNSKGNFLITRTNNIKIQLVKISISEDCGKLGRDCGKLGRGIPGLNLAGLSRGLKNSGTWSRGLKICSLLEG